MQKLHLKTTSIDSTQVYTIYLSFSYLDTLSWERIQASGRLPPPRSAHQMSAIGDRLYMFGGGSWVSGTDWEKLFPSIFMLDTSEENRFSHSDIFRNNVLD